VLVRVSRQSGIIYEYCHRNRNLSRQPDSVNIWLNEPSMQKGILHVRGWRVHIQQPHSFTGVGMKLILGDWAGASVVQHFVSAVIVGRSSQTSKNGPKACTTSINRGRTYLIYSRLPNTLECSVYACYSAYYEKATTTKITCCFAISILHDNCMGYNG